MIIESFALLLSATAIPSDCGKIVALRQSFEEETIEIVVDTKLLAATKSWRAGTTLPMSVESSVSIAQKWLEENRKLARIRSVSIQRSPCIAPSQPDKWYYMVYFSDGSEAEGAVAILFDGTLVAPLISKRLAD